MVHALSGYASALIWLLISSCLLTGALTEWHTSTIRWNGVATSLNAIYDTAHGVQPQTEDAVETLRSRQSPIPMSSYTSNVCLLLTSIYYHGPASQSAAAYQRTEHVWPLLSGTVTRNHWLATFKPADIQHRIHPYSGHMLRIRKNNGTSFYLS